MTEWLKTAVFYEIYPQSFMDSDGDGIGDLNGITGKLDYIRELGCSAIWLNPCFDSPFADAGYDVRDYKKVAERYGTMEDMVRLFEEVHKRGMHILLDLVPGHTSEEHVWFRESARADRNRYSDYYIWTDMWLERAEGFAYIAGACERNGTYVLNFFKSQPALNYGFLHPEKPWQKAMDDPACLAVREAMEDVMCFWLEKGCDGFRVDMADSLVKNDDGDKSGTCEVWMDMIGKVRERYPDAVLVSEWNNPVSAIGRAGFQMDFFLDWRGNGYNLLLRDYDENGRDNSFFKKESDRSILDFLDEYLPKYEAVKEKGFYCLITGNHDTIRAAYHLTERELQVAYAFLLTMPGAPFLYYGDEIGMGYLELPTKEGGYTRTGSRTPMQWTNDRNYGFSEAAADRLYLPQDRRPEAPTVEKQKRRTDSIYHTVKEVLALRKKESAFARHDNLSILAARRDRRGFMYQRDDLVFVCNPSDREEELTCAGSPLHNNKKEMMSADSFPETEKIFEIGSVCCGEQGFRAGPQSFAVLRAGKQIQGQ